MQANGTHSVIAMLAMNKPRAEQRSRVDNNTYNRG